MPYSTNSFRVLRAARLRVHDHDEGRVGEAADGGKIRPSITGLRHRGQVCRHVGGVEQQRVAIRRAARDGACRGRRVGAGHGFRQCTRWPSVFDMPSASRRASRSVPPPARKPTTSVTSRFGNCWAEAGAASGPTASAARAAANASLSFIQSSGVPMADSRRRDILDTARQAATMSNDFRV